MGEHEESDHVPAATFLDIGRLPDMASSRRGCAINELNFLSQFSELVRRSRSDEPLKERNQFPRIPVPSCEEVVRKLASRETQKDVTPRSQALNMNWSLRSIS